MNSWSKDGGFYKTPGVKVLLVWTSASSFLYRLLAARNSAHSMVLWFVRVWALPSAGMWLAMALVLYSCRTIERRMGSNKFVGFLLSSCLIGICVAALMQCVGNVAGHPVELHWACGVLMHMLTGALAVEFAHSVVPLYSKKLLGIPVSSNLVFYLIVLMFNVTSQNSFLAMLCGATGGTVAHYTGYGMFPSWLSLGLGKLFHHERPPFIFSGASLEVQREQRMDHLERIMANMYRRRQRPPAGLHVPMHRHQPSNSQVQQLTAMGFQRSEVYQALLDTGSDTTAAVQLLTSRNN